MFQRAHFALSLTNHSTGADEMEQLEAHTRAECCLMMLDATGSAVRKAWRRVYRMLEIGTGACSMWPNADGCYWICFQGGGSIGCLKSGQEPVACGLMLMDATGSACREAGLGCLKPLLQKSTD
eukprot:1161357-Pelagomonas_calceolata.AAC.3